MDIARMIDHTLLKQDASSEAIVKLCQEAKEFHFASVCVNPGFVPLAAKELKGTEDRGQSKEKCPPAASAEGDAAADQRGYRGDDGQKNSMSVSVVLW